MAKTVFVFGSNLAGRHGKGAAQDAYLHHGAKYGVGNGRMGDAYAIPTKDAYLKPRSIEAIRESVEEFLKYAQEHPEETFNVTPIGCGYAGYKPRDIAPMFINRTSNVHLPEIFKLWLQNKKKTTTILDLVS
jgi:hypothetical protein